MVRVRAAKMASVRATGTHATANADLIGAEDAVPSARGVRLSPDLFVRGVRL
jgi:hypothetical protein